MNNLRIAVTSRSFSKNSVLRSELQERFSNVKFNDDGVKFDQKTLVQFLQGADRAIVALEQIDEQVLSQLPELKVLSKYGVGLDNIDLEALKKHGVRLGWKAGVNRRAVSELSIGLMIALLRVVPLLNQEVREGTWRQVPGRHLSNQTVGIVGLGNIGKDLVRLLQPWGCSFLSNDIVDDIEFRRAYHVDSVSLQELLQQADIVTLHVPLDPSTQGLIGATEFEQMKSTSILINTCRGNVVDEVALKEALQGGVIGAAACDVFAAEPPEDDDLIRLPNFLATPHIGGSSQEAILAMGRSAIAELEN